MAKKYTDKDYEKKLKELKSEAKLLSMTRIINDIQKKKTRKDKGWAITEWVEHIAGCQNDAVDMIGASYREWKRLTKLYNSKSKLNKLRGIKKPSMAEINKYEKYREEFWKLRDIFSDKRSELETYGYDHNIPFFD